jgi:SpoVK/Ycf46/Vps4 family AAA+-type ATPase
MTIHVALANDSTSSVLLRALEYFQGIMFLTTNRVESIDSAFKSRIHLSLYYPPLSLSARTSIWKTHIARGSAQGPPAWLDAQLIDRLASYDINGRQIKNTVRMACSIAANDKRELSARDLLKGLEAWTEFEVDFGGGRRRGVLRRLRNGMRGYVWAKVMLAFRFSAYFPKRMFRGRSRNGSRRPRLG